MSESIKQQVLFYYGKGLNPAEISKLLGQDYHEVDLFLMDFDNRREDF